MSVIRIASRYAKSLLDLAKEQNKLERILEDVKAFQKAAGQRDFELLLKSPIVKTDKKQAIIKQIFGSKFDPLTMIFLDVILRKGRERYLGGVADEFVAQYRKEKHISTVYLTTAGPIDPESLQIIKMQLMTSDVTDRNVDIKTKVDPDLIGGFVIEFDDKLYDASVSHKLELLRKEFSGNDYKKKI